MLIAEGTAGPRRGWWRPAVWLIMTAAAALPPGPSLAAGGLVLLGGAGALGAERIASIPRRLALLTLTAVAGVAATLVAPGNAFVVVPVLVAGVSISRLVPWRRTVIVAGAVLTVVFALAVAHQSGSPWALLAGLGVPLIMSRSWDREALRREHARTVALLGELEERRDADLRAAAVEERARIARDLHDVLAHTLSGLSLHLQAARAVAARDGERADPTLVTTIDRAADLARSGLDEARRAVTALHTDEPAPCRADLEELVSTRAALEVDGPFDALAAPVRETVFATVREALTNAGRHAPGAPVTVRVAARDADTVEVRVHDEGATAAPVPGDRGGGRGLTGLAERADRVGGHLDARPDGAGWTVTLRVPEDRS